MLVTLDESEVTVWRVGNAAGMGSVCCVRELVTVHDLKVTVCSYDNTEDTQRLFGPLVVVMCLSVGQAVCVCLIAGVFLTSMVVFVCHIKVNLLTYQNIFSYFKIYELAH